MRRPAAELKVNVKSMNMTKNMGAATEKMEAARKEPVVAVVRLRGAAERLPRGIWMTGTASARSSAWLSVKEP